jgi:hypothetical protein
MKQKRSYEELKADIGTLSIEEIPATSVGKKIDQVFALTEAWRESIKDKLRGRYPLASEDEVKRRFAVVWLGRDLTKEVYGWEVDGDDSDLLVR